MAVAAKPQAKSDDTGGEIFAFIGGALVLLAVIAASLPIIGLTLVELVGGTMLWLMLAKWRGISPALATVITGVVPAMIAYPSIQQLLSGVPLEDLFQRYWAAQAPWTPDLATLTDRRLWSNPFTRDSFPAYWAGVAPLATLAAPVLAGGIVLCFKLMATVNDVAEGDNLLGKAVATYTRVINYGSGNINSFGHFTNSGVLDARDGGRLASSGRHAPPDA